jgi:uncharacterized protein
VRRLAVDVQPGEYAVAKLPAGTTPPAALFATLGALVSITATRDEVSIVCPARLAPATDALDAGWRLLTVRGPLEFTLTGILAALTGELAAAGVSVFAISTYDTDHLLVKQADVNLAIQALTEGGHEVHR